MTSLHHTSPAHRKSVSDTRTDTASDTMMYEPLVLEASFGEWLRQRRRELDLTQADLAQQVGCSEITIRKIEADDRTPSRQVAERLAACLEVPAAERQTFVTFARGLPRGDDLPLPTPPVVTPAGLPAPANLPIPLTPLLGREPEMAQIGAALLRDDLRLLTLIGPPGIGKTRLSLQVAAELRAHFQDGVCFIALASISDPALVMNAIAQALHISETANQPLLDRLCGALRDRQMLLVLDNFEHLLAAAPEVAQLLTACPQLTVLATSRAALRVRGEQLFPVEPLGLPELAWPIEARAIARSPAVMLFVARTRAVMPNFTLSEENAPAVAAICARLDGLPLAIELVAARSRTLSPLALLSRLGQRLDLLAHGSCDLPPRHRTLRSAIEWSYNLLSPAEQRLFAWLGVFIGEYSLHAIEAVALEMSADGLLNGEEAASLAFNAPFSILDLLAALVDQSLLCQIEGPGGEPRFMMLETIREYALERLRESGQLPALRRRHARYYLGLAEGAEPELSGAGQEQWLDRLEREHDHFRAALVWALEQGEGSLETGVRLGAALWRFWYTRCHLIEGRRWLNMILEAGLPLLGRPSAVSSPQQHQRLKGYIARALLGTGVLARVQGAYAEARHLHQVGLDVALQIDDRRVIAAALYNLGLSTYDEGQAAPAIGYLEQCLAIQRALGDEGEIATTLNGLGNLLLGLDDARAVALFEESVAVQRALGNTRGIAFTLHSLGIAALQGGCYATAQRHFREGQVHFEQLDDTIGIADCLSGLAAVAGGQGRRERAAQLWGAAEALRERIGAPLPANEREIYERHLPVLEKGGV